MYKSYVNTIGYNLELGGRRGEPSSQTILKKIKSSKKIKVGQYNLNGELIRIFNSFKEASRFLNISDSDIHRCCKNNGTRNGFMFSKSLNEKIKPYKINYALKKYKIINLISNEETIIEGLNNVSAFINCSRKYVDNIIKRKTIYKKQFKIERYEC